jgi:DNA-binding LytR/AlgR family response regulator
MDIIIYDENPIRVQKIRNALDEILSAHKTRGRITDAGDGAELIKLLNDDADSIAVVFLDMRSTYEGNRRLAEDIMARFPKVTVFDSSHVDRHHHEGSGNLPRPTSAHMLMKALGLTSSEAEQETAIILTVKTKGAVHNFFIKNIEYIMSDRRLIIIHENGKETSAYAKLDDIEERIGPASSDATRATW